MEIAQIGLGYWGPNLLRTFTGLPGVHIAGLCDRDTLILQRYQEKYPDTRCESDYLQLFKDPNIDAIVIATPAHTHYQIALDALRAGKHIFVEKPLALSTGECEHLLKEADRQDRIVMVGHIFLFNTIVNYIESYLRAGHIGDLYYIDSQRLNLGIVRSDLNAMWNFAPHDFSILLHWIRQPVLSVSARGSTFLQDGVEDVVFINVQFDKNISAHIHVSWLNPVKVRQMTIVGSEKMLVYDDVHPEQKLKVYDKGIDKQSIESSFGRFETFDQFQFLVRAGDEWIPKISFVEPMLLECKHFIECITTHTVPLTDGEHGMQVVRLLEAAQQSMRTGGQEVRLES